MKRAYRSVKHVHPVHRGCAKCRITFGLPTEGFMIGRSITLSPNVSFAVSMSAIALPSCLPAGTLAGQMGYGHGTDAPDYSVASSIRASVSARPRTSIISNTLGLAILPARAARKGCASLPRPRPCSCANAPTLSSSSVRVHVAVLQARRQFSQYTAGYIIQSLGRLLVGLNGPVC